MKFLLLIFAVLSAAAALDYADGDFLSYLQEIDSPSDDLNVEESVLPLILGGTETQWGQFPSAVLLDGPNDFCGGSIIHDTHVVTSASCVLNSRLEIINPSYWRVIAGDIFFTPPSGVRVTRGVSRIFVHDRYNPFTGENNIAIMRLDQPVPLPHNSIEVARRRTTITRNGHQCQLVGFGRSSNLTTVAFRARQINLAQSIMDREQCESAFPHPNRLAQTMICTQTTSTAAPCSGSIGSGLYCDGFLTGVMSGGNYCNAAPALHQQIRAFNRWIDEMIRQPQNVEQVLTPIAPRGLP